MNLIKRIASCGLALSIAFSGVHAEPTKNQSNKKPVSSSISAKITELANKPITKNQLIGGSCTLLGTGILTGIVTGVCLNYTNKMPVLVIGKNPDDRKKLIDSIKNNTDGVSKKLYDTITDSLCERPIIRMDVRKAKVNNWNIRQCGIDDKNLESLVKKSKIVLTILDSQETTNTLHDTFERIPDLYSRRIISVDATEQGITYPNQTHGIKDFKLLNYYFTLIWDKKNDKFFDMSDGQQLLGNMFGSIFEGAFSRGILEARRNKEAAKNKAWNEWIRNNPKPQA